MVTLNITSGPSFEIAWQAGMNGQTALEAAYNAPSNQASLTFMLQYYGSGLGYLVDMINGTYDSSLSAYAPYYFWDFIVNGQSSPTGIDNTPIHDGDTITFAFIIYDAEKHAGTALAAKYSAKSAP